MRNSLDSGEALRSEIALSWHRAKLHGVDPASSGLRPAEDVDRSSRLIVAAAPVIRDLAMRLDNQPYCVMLADRDCRLVHQWSGNTRLRSALEDHGVLVGSELDEGTAGTNALGTPFETGRSIVVNGAEHYLDVFKGFSCYGHPIRHPITGRVEGVLDITAPTAEGSPLFGPLLSRAAQDIEARILDGARATDRRLFLAFENATRRRSTAIAVLGGDVVLANRSCLDRLGAADPSVLRTLLAEVATKGTLDRVLELPRMGRVRVQAEKIPDTGGALFHLGDREPAGPSPGRVPSRTTWRTLLIAGEPGTGRTTAALRAAAGVEVVTLDAATAITGSERAWAARLADLVATHTGVLIIDDVHLLSERLCTVVRRIVTGPSAPKVIMTSDQVDELPAPAARLAAHCGRRTELAPLRDRLDELAALTRTLAAARHPGREVVFSPGALDLLGAHLWPGNLTELAGLIDDLSARPTAGYVGPADLPERYRGQTRFPGLGGRDRAERMAIVTALRECDGNKARAAEQLGISRPTLYRRMRALHVVAGQT